MDHPRTPSAQIALFDPEKATLRQKKTGHLPDIVAECGESYSKCPGVSSSE